MKKFLIAASFSFFFLTSLFTVAGGSETKDMKNDPPTWQVTRNRPPLADGGRDTVTFVSAKTLFRGFGASEKGFIVKYEWDFDGDGRYDWESKKNGLTDHVYQVTGNYKAIFRVTDSAGHSSIDFITAYVNEGEGKQTFPVKKIEKLLNEKKSEIIGDGTIKRFAVMINGGSESRFWNDVTFMYATLINDYQFTPESIYLFHYDGYNPSGENPDSMIDYPADKPNLYDVFNELGSVIDSDDELFVWVTDHGRGYSGLHSQGGKYFGYLDGYASIDPGDEEDYLESDFKLRSFFMGGYHRSNHGMAVWKVYENYFSGHYHTWRIKYVSHFTDVYFEDIDRLKSDEDVFIEKFVDYLEGDFDRNGIIEFDKGEVFDYDGDGVPPYDPATGSFDADDWGFIDHYDDDIRRISTRVPGYNYMLFDAGLDNRLDIDINYDLENLEIDGTDVDNEGLFDGIDINSDGDLDDWVSIDEVICMYGDDLTDDELAGLLDQIGAGIISIFMEPCFSGGFIEDLSSPGRVISTATTEESVSYGNLFVSNFTSALHKADPTGSPVDADDDGDGFISMQEAFNYAALNDYYDEVPQYDDNGDGISHPYPIPNGEDGHLGANVFLADKPGGIDISIYPTTSTIPRGKNLNYWVNFTNNRNMMQCFDYAATSILPNGETYPAAGVLFDPYRLCLAAQESMQYFFNHRIPYSAALGTYIYNAYVGVFNLNMGIYVPVEIWNKDHFEFNILKR
jgi:hypothetical protein